MGTVGTVYKQSNFIPSHHGESILEEAIDLEDNGKLGSAKEKYIQAIDAFKLALTSCPHDITAREGILKCWKQLASLDSDSHFYEFPEGIDYMPEDAPSRSVGFSFIKTIFVDAFVEKDWKKQCDGKYGGPKPFESSWKEFYFDNEAQISKMESVQDKLIWAVQKGHHCLIKYLFLNESGLSIDATLGDTQETLLEIAVKKEFLLVMQLLIDNGAKVNVKGQLKWTLLHWAVQRGNLSIVRCLVEHGARVNVKEENGLTPLHLAAMNGYDEMIDYLVDKKAKVNISGRVYSVSPLQLAVYNNHRCCTEKLINYNADTEVVDCYKRTLLHWATANGYSDIVTLLLNRGNFTVNICDDMGRTPLHWAAQGGYIDIMTVLIENAAKTTIEDKFGDTPLTIAAFLGYSKEVLVLFNHGAR